jgi:hypothetical protein
VGESKLGEDKSAALSRYETTIERALFKTLNELRVLQEKRQQAADPISAQRELKASSPQEPEPPRVVVNRRTSANTELEREAPSPSW